MNLRNTINTGVAVVTMATAPMTAVAKSTAKNVVNNSTKVERTMVKEGDKFIQTIKTFDASTGKLISSSTVKSTAKPIAPVQNDAHGQIRAGIDYSVQEVLGRHKSEPRINFMFDAQPSAHTYFRPKAAIGKETYSAVVPLGLKTNIAPNLSIEGGADLAGVRGLMGGNKVLFSKDVQKVADGTNTCISSYSGEFYQDLHAGVRYQNKNVNASLKGEVGHTYVYGDGFINDGKRLHAEDLKTTNIPVVNKPKTQYVGARADIEVAPLKNKNFTINAEGSISSNKSAEGNIGVGYRF
jgi:hypothetical protein